jgi:leader peptidase (prepilin peptidase) / N-methyltransferase
VSAGLVTGVVLLGALAGAAAVPLARRFTVPAPRVGAAGSGPVGPGSAAGEPSVPHRPAGRLGTSLAGAVVFGGLAGALGADPALPAFLVVAAVGLVLARVDLSCLRLPDPLVALAAAGGGLALVVAALAAGTPGRLVSALAGAAVSFAGYVLLALLPGARLGFGDVKLAAALGLPLGWLGWPVLGLGLLLPHLLNGVVVLALLAARRVRRDTALPFGPALLTGAWLAVLLA